MIDSTKNNPLAQRRRQLGWSRAELSRRLDGSPSAETIARIERGERVPRHDTLMRLADALDCDVEYLTGSISYTKREVADVAEQIPFSGETIELLRELKKDCDDWGEASDAAICASFFDSILFTSLTNDIYKGIGGLLFQLLSVLTEQCSIIQECNADGFVPFREEADSDSVRLMSALQIKEDSLSHIGDIFKELTQEFAERYAAERIRKAREERNNGKEKK